VIAVTACAMDSDLEKCLVAGMDGYIAKPVDLGDIAAVLQNITPLRRTKGRRKEQSGV
jgi:CheY-like chemotaxis protein